MSERARPVAPRFARGLLLLTVVVLYAPLVTMVAGAFTRPEGEGLFFWFGEVLRDPVLLGALRHSLLVAVVASFLATALGAGGAVALHHGVVPGGAWLRRFAAATLLMPEIVFALALLLWFSALKWTLGLWTVALAHVTFSISYAMLTVSARLGQIDGSLRDAASDLGASEVHYLSRVLLPLLAPALAASFLLCFLLSFDDFLITFFVNGAGRDTLPVKLYSSMRTGTTPKLNALATLLWLATSLALVFALRAPALRGLMKSHSPGGPS